MVCLGSIHCRFVHLILNSMVDCYDTDLTNALIFVPVVWWWSCTSFDIEYHTSHFRHQTTGTKNKCIDWVFIKVIDSRIRDQMPKKTMNWPLESWKELCCWEFYFSVFTSLNLAYFVGSIMVCVESWKELYVDKTYISPCQSNKVVCTMYSTYDYIALTGKSSVYIQHFLSSIS